MREIIRSLPEAYKNDLKPVIVSLVHTQADPSKEVSLKFCCSFVLLLSYNGFINSVLIA